jgi:hypothetical protein
MCYLNPSDKMKPTLYISLIFLLACKDSTQRLHNSGENSKTKIISYLKQNFHVSVDTSKMGFYYKQALREQNLSLELDSLMSAKIFIREYRPLNLRFITYDNYFGISDTSREDHFSVNLIEDQNNGTFYIDYVNDKAGMITEDFCEWTYRVDKISGSDISSDISNEDIEAYNSIHSNRIYQHETGFANRKTGIQSYLNSVFRFFRPTKTQLDSLFYSYDKFFYHRKDTVLKSPNDLYGFLRVQAARMRSEPDYGSLERQLGFLKDQVDILLLQVEQPSNEDSYLWIYKESPRLRVRKLQISGNKKSTYSYSLVEYQACF